MSQYAFVGPIPNKSQLQVFTIENCFDQVLTFEKQISLSIKNQAQNMCSPLFTFILTLLMKALMLKRQEVFLSISGSCYATLDDKSRRFNGLVNRNFLYFKGVKYNIGQLSSVLNTISSKVDLL